MFSYSTYHISSVRKVSTCSLTVAGRLVWDLNTCTLYSTCLDNPSLRNPVCDEELEAFNNNDLKHVEK